MALNIKDTETEKLAAEVAEMTGETKVEAVREALREKKGRLDSRRSKGGQKPQSMQEWLETEIWPHIPEEELGKPPLTKAEIAEILGYGSEED